MFFDNTLTFLGGLGGWEVLLILLIVLILFGAKRIPELARGLGKGIREFKDATTDIKNEIEDSVKDDRPAVKR
ncbi:MAG: twin-arginine translocase TatA/TatE family subunit [Catalinimonas sp.]